MGLPGSCAYLLAIHSEGIGSGRIKMKQRTRQTIENKQEYEQMPEYVTLPSCSPGLRPIT
jgi:hypothetical protein